jgi:ribonuclease J
MNMITNYQPNKYKKQKESGTQNDSAGKKEGKRENYTPQSKKRSGRSGRDFRKTGKPAQSNKPSMIKKYFGSKDSNNLKVIVLGGLEEVGRNMTLLECNKEIIIIDMGLQFPEENMPGIDCVIPNISYLKGKEDWIKGVIITHGHYDHTGAIPYLINELGNPPIFGGGLATNMIKRKCREYKQCPELHLQSINEESVIRLGNSFRVEFLKMNHSIPDCYAPIVDTPFGRVMHTGDYKIDYAPVNDKPTDLNRIAQVGAKGIKLLMSDSTDAVDPGHQVSESVIGDELGEIFEKVDGRVILGTFASQLSRIQKIFDLAAMHGRKVYLQGRSMNDNVQLAKEIGYLKFNPKLLVEDNEFKRLPDNKVIVVGTGVQGESNAFLTKVVNREHRTVSLKQGDTVIFSSSVIPGNERSIQNLKDIITRQGAHIIHYEMMDVHAGGHAKQEDIKLMLRLLQPEYLMPIEGNHYLLKAQAELAKNVGIDAKKVFVADNGQVVEFSKNAQGESVGVLTDKRVPSDYVMVDGLGVGDVSHIVLRDRQVMAADGMIVIIATINSRTGNSIGNPDIISRGFVYMKESRELIESTRMKVKKLVQDNDSSTPADVDHIKNKIRDEIGQYLYDKSNRRPMVLPVVIKV